MGSLLITGRTGGDLERLDFLVRYLVGDLDLDPDSLLLLLLLLFNQGRSSFRALRRDSRLLPLRPLLLLLLRLRLLLRVRRRGPLADIFTKQMTIYLEITFPCGK